MKNVLVFILLLSVAGAIYYFLFESQISSEETSMKSTEMVSYQLPEDGSPFLTFAMPENYETYKKGLPNALSFRADTYIAESVTAEDAKQELATSPSEENSFLADIDVPGNGLKRCIESSNGMSVDIQMLSDLDLPSPEEFIENTIATNNTINNNTVRDIKTSTTTIDRRIFVRSEQIQPECEYSYAITHAGNINDHLAQFNFRFEGDYEKNLAIIEAVLDSVDFKME